VAEQDDVEEFARLARPLLDADPVRHPLALTVLERVRGGSFTAALMATVHRRGRSPEPRCAPPAAR